MDFHKWFKKFSYKMPRFQEYLDGLNLFQLEQLRKYTEGYPDPVRVYQMIDNQIARIKGLPLQYKILVTGGAGFIGSRLIESLLEGQHIVESVDDYSIGSKDNHKDGCFYHSMAVDEFVKSEVGDKSNYDLIFHLAGRSRIQPSFDEPHGTFTANTNATSSLLQYAHERGIKVIYAGSSSRHHNPYQSPYATTKHLGEELCRMYRESYGLEVEIVRFYNVYGRGEIIEGKWSAVIGIWRRQVANKQPITIVGDGKQRRDFTRVEDIVCALMSIAFLNSDEHNVDAWELGSGTNYSILEVANWFVDFAGASIEYVDNQKGNYQETLRISDEAIDLINWKPKDGLKDYIQSLYND